MKVWGNIGSLTITLGVPFLYSLKTSRNCRFSDVFSGYKNETSASNRLRMTIWFQRFP